MLKSIVTFATYWSLSATRLVIPSSQLTGCPKSSVHNAQPVLSSLSQPPLADDGHTHVVKGCVTVLIELGLNCKGESTIEKTRRPAGLLYFSEGKRLLNETTFKSSRFPREKLRKAVTSIRKVFRSHLLPHCFK